MAEDLSSRGEHRVVRRADHLSIVTGRGYARQVADAILEVAGRTRTA